MTSVPSSGALDLAVLDAQTFGDRALQAELLDLFEKQCTRLLPALGQRSGRDAAIAAAHTLKGSASAVGARDVVVLAGALELALAGGDEEGSPALISSLQEAVADVRRAIGQWREAS